MISLDNLSLAYNENLILDKINLVIDQGSTLALIGPSGCGKSSLLNLVAGLTKPSAGTVTINNQPINNKKQIIGYIPQNYGLLPWLTVEANIMLGLKIKEGSQAKLPTDLVNKLGLSKLLKRYPKELSGGQQQRVSLLRAFALKADVLLMDEPFSALDTITREEMQNVFLDLWQEAKPTTILVTHFVEEALYLGKHIAIMSHNPGRIYKNLDNPLFACQDFRENKDFLTLAKDLRKDLKQVIQDEN